jgi:hypothetical protein
LSNQPIIFSNISCDVFNITETKAHRSWKSALEERVNMFYVRWFASSLSAITELESRFALPGKIDIPAWLGLRRFDQLEGEFPSAHPIAKSFSGGVLAGDATVTKVIK